MIKPEDDTVIASDKSCFKDEIVAKLLGWMQGSIRLECVRMNQYNTGIIADHVPHMQGLFVPLNDQLIALRQEAQGKLYDVVDSLQAATEVGDEGAYSAAEKLIPEKDAAIVACDVLINKATQYMSDVEDEIDKGEASAFVRYPSVPESPDEPRYTIKSIERWSLNKYGISVIDFANSEVLAENFNAQLKLLENTAPEAGIKVKNRRHDALSAELESILDFMHKPTASTVMAELRKLIGSERTCILTNVGDGIKWDDGNGKSSILTTKALCERIRTWRKHRLSTG